MFSSFIRRSACSGQQAALRHYASAAATAGAAAPLARRAVILFPAAGLGAYAVLGDEPRCVAYFSTTTSVRLIRDARTVLAILADYKWSLRRLEGPAREAALTACHQRGADRLLWLCKANGGIYIKLGQHIGMLDHLLPVEYVLTMRAHLLDRCPVSSWDSVRRTIEEDLGRPLDELYAEIDPVPVASASLAQVHSARDAATGRRLAVKVQHRGLRETSAVDLATIRGLVRLVRYFAPAADMMWLVEEAEENLPRELDFLVEAANAERCASNLSSPKCRVRGRVAVPPIDHSRTSHRVLTMHFIEGVKVTDKGALAEMGVPAAALARLISETFNEMIFLFGDVHADPHAANMLVQRAPPEVKVKWQLVLLDHGLYRRLSKDFRLEYASLWRSLIYADVAGITKSARRMNAGDAVPIFAGMVTAKPWDQVSQASGGGERLQLNYTATERDEMQQYAGQYAKEIGDLLARVPRELLLLLKTNDCLRAVDAELGAGVSSYIITARECERALAAERWQQRGWSGAAHSLVESARMEALLAALKAAAWLAPRRGARALPADGPAAL